MKQVVAQLVKRKESHIMSLHVKKSKNSKKDVSSFDFLLDPADDIYADFYYSHLKSEKNSAR